MPLSRIRKFQINSLFKEDQVTHDWKRYSRAKTWWRTMLRHFIASFTYLFIIKALLTQHVHKEKLSNISVTIMLLFLSNCRSNHGRFLSYDRALLRGRFASTNLADEISKFHRHDCESGVQSNQEKVRETILKPALLPAGERRMVREGWRRAKYGVWLPKRGQDAIGSAKTVYGFSTSYLVSVSSHLSFIRDKSMTAPPTALAVLVDCRTVQEVL